MPGGEREAAAPRERRRPLAWWRQPGVLLFAAALALALVGWGLVIRQSRNIPVRRATVAGLDLRLEQARWILDQMEHGDNFRKPAAMMPDMPEWGKQRVTLELTLYNRSQASQTFDGAEFFLVPELGPEVPVGGAQVGIAQLGPDQALNTAIHFDLDTTLPHGPLRVEWRRAGEKVVLPVPEPPEHYHLRPRAAAVSFPPEARLVLPLGEPQRGEELFETVYGCAACHGDLERPGTNAVGPHLAGIATAAATRVEGLPAAQYLYESILDPNAFIAPECTGGRPCQQPTAMPEYGSLLSLQDLADLLVYLTEQRG